MTNAIAFEPTVRNHLDVEDAPRAREIEGIYKAPPLLITLNLVTGQPKTYRLVAQMGQLGVMISPLVENTLELASLYGGFCLGPVNTAGGHALAYPLGTRWHVAHGAANALIFPHVLAFNTPSVPDKTQAIMEALALGKSGSEQHVFEATHRFCASLGIEMALSGLGVPQDDLETMTDDAFAIRRLLDNNPRDLARADILKIYQTAY